jgi:hypothetical protein
VTTHSPLLADRLPADALYAVCRTGGETRIERLATWGPLGRRTAINEALDDPVANATIAEPPLTVSARLLRGDFDA